MENKFRQYFLLFISLYVLYLVGMVYSENIEFGIRDLETKLSLLVFPFIYFTSEKLNCRQIHSIFNAFVYGCLLSAAICFFYALYQYIYTQYLIAQGIWAWDYGINFFLKNRLSIWIHPSYRAMYFLMALVMIYFQNKYESGYSILMLNDFAKSSDASNLLRPRQVGAGIYKSWFRKLIHCRDKWKMYCISFILCVFILLFSSKAGLLSLLLFGVFVLWQMIFVGRKYKLSAFIILISGIIFFSLYFSAPQFALKVDGTFNTLAGNTDIRNSEESTASRIDIWKATTEVILENLIIGTGTGDIKDALLSEYQKQDMLFERKYELNAHNQFLQTFAALGIAGFLVLFASFAIPFFWCWKKRKYIYGIFLLLTFFNFLVESMLETQAGVIFYAFFNSLLLFSNDKTE